MSPSITHAKVSLDAVAATAIGAVERELITALRVDAPTVAEPGRAAGISGCSLDVRDEQARREVAMIVFSGTTAEIWATNSLFTSRRSGPFSCTKSASASALPTESGQKLELMCSIWIRGVNICSRMQPCPETFPLA